MQCPKAVVFDLDDTLAESFQAPKPSMIERLSRLLPLLPVAILSAASFHRMERDFLGVLEESPSVGQLYLMPNSSAQAYQWDKGWQLVYGVALSEADRERIKRAIAESVVETGVIGPNPKYLPLIVDRGVQIAYAALGLEASQEEKAAWDPDRSKRNMLKEAIDKRLPEFEVLLGGTTTIDITAKGIDKSHGVRWLADQLGILPSEMLFIGDALYEGGNDAVVIPTGIKTHPVKNPDDTEKIIDELLASCSV